VGQLPRPLSEAHYPGCTLDRNHPGGCSTATHSAGHERRVPRGLATGPDRQVLQERIAASEKLVREQQQQVADLIDLFPRGTTLTVAYGPKATVTLSLADLRRIAAGYTPGLGD
jgi:hypothetical protein